MILGSDAKLPAVLKEVSRLLRTVDIENAAGEARLDVIGELAKALLHHAPPNTSTSPKRHTGAAWPTRIT